jgi:hypothetical protein
MNVEALGFANGNQLTFIIIFSVIFGLLTIGELFTAFIEQDKARKIIKPFLMLSATLLCIVLFPMQPFLYLGCFFGMLGDICFIFKDKKPCVYVGLLTFGLNHLFYIMEMISILTYKNLMIQNYYIIFALVYFIFAVAMFFAIRIVIKAEVPLALCGCLYMMILFMDFGVNILMVNCGFPLMWYGIIGLVLFIISDSFLTYTMFIKDVKRRDFYIMFTYLAAQVLFLVGIISTLSSSI